MWAPSGASSHGTPYQRDSGGPNREGGAASRQQGAGRVRGRAQCSGCTPTEGVASQQQGGGQVHLVPVQVLKVKFN